MDKLSLEQGETLVRLARKSISYAIAAGKKLRELCADQELLGQRGVFVTLETFPERALRGCIGFPYPVMPLWNAVQDAAIEAALNDPRFPGVGAAELESIVVEVSVLTRPEEIKTGKKDVLHEINVGKDGLIVQRNQRSGLLLPQVATEQEWDAKTFLEQCCAKAGLMENIWQSKETRIFKFRAQIFSETEPNGKVEEKTS